MLCGVVMVGSKGLETGTLYDPANDGWFMESEGCFAGQIGPIWRKHLDEGEAVGIVIDDRHLNRYGVVHGGVLVALFDESLGPPCYAFAGQHAQLATVHMGSLLLHSVQAGQFVVGVSQVTRQTATLIFARGECRVGNMSVMTGDAIIKIRRTVPGWAAPATPPKPSKSF